MNLDFTEEQEMLPDSLRGMCEAGSDNRAVRRAELDPAAPMTEIWRSLGMRVFWDSALRKCMAAQDWA
ncbi:hypothetical protein [Sphingobium estronivorans]|uniref:hypothetical protein n=1 Tax=Sphingobium estronivorans TaxID=1577690 RepID=UPI0013C31360|nr:hypothetical protein [Sphingobium estronivorans]